MLGKLIAGAFVASLPWWLPGRVVALRTRLFARVNGDGAVPVPGPLAGADRFVELYSHPAAGGRSKGAALSDLFWYWLSPGAELHQEHLEAGPRHDAVARATRAFLSLPRTDIEELTRRAAARTLPDAGGLVRLRDLMMPLWAEFAYELVFGEPCPRAARELIVGNADDVVTALKCCGPRHMARRHRLTRYLEDRLDMVRLSTPDGLTTRERALYLQGVFFTTAVVQLAEGMAHLLMVLARHPGVQDRARTGDIRYLDQVIQETFRLYPLFGVAHRVTTADIPVGGSTIPAGSVLCFNYPEFHRAGYPEPGRFDPERIRENHVPFGVAANRPCPAWRVAPIAMRVAAAEVLRRFALETTAAHTRSLPSRGPCLLTPRHGAPRPDRRRLLLYLRVRDRWEDVWRSVVQLVLGAYMVWDARRLRLCERHFGLSMEGDPGDPHDR